MKSLVTSLVTVSIVIFGLCAAPVQGTTLRLSDHSSEGEGQPYLYEYLDAKLNFAVAGDTLTVRVTNLTPENEGDPVFKMNKIYFNVSDEVEGLSLIDVSGPDVSSTEGWELGYIENGFLVGGSGWFDVSIKGGHGIHTPVIEPGQTVSFVLQIFGNESYTDDDFIELSSPQGGHILSYAAAKFYNDYASAYGATSVPEPATVCLLTFGGLVLLRKRSR